MQQNCTTLVKNVTIGLIKLRQWSSDSLLETFSRFQPDWADAIRKTYHVKLISITAICIDTFIFCGILRDTYSAIANSFIIIISISNEIEQVGEGICKRPPVPQLSCNNTPLRPQFTGPSHQVLFLPTYPPTYLPTYFPTFVIMIWDRNLWLNHFYHLNLDTYPPPNTQVQTNFGLFLSVPFSSPTQSRLIDHRTKYFHDLNTSLHVRYISGKSPPRPWS